MEFSPIPSVETPWDCAGILVRGRIRARALGMAPLDSEPPIIAAAVPWSWTSPGFLTCEEMVTRLESLPVTEDAMVVWSETLRQVRQAADVGRERMEDRSEGFARDYWIRRGELELAVIGAMLNRDNLLPYHKRSPREFLVQRVVFLNQALAETRGASRDVLSWLAVEHEEALQILDWIQGQGGWTVAKDHRWVEALDELERQKKSDGSVDRGLLALTGAALGGSEDPLTAARTRWEAGLRPLLMEIRSGVRSASP